MSTRTGAGCLIDPFVVKAIAMIYVIIVTYLQIIHYSLNLMDIGSVAKLLIDKLIGFQSDLCGKIMSRCRVANLQVIFRI